MKRLLIAVFQTVLLIMLASPMLAFDASSPGVMRIGIVRADGTYRFERDGSVQKIVQQALRDELRRRGFDAFAAEATLDQMARYEDRTADYLVEVVGDADTRDYGGIGIGSRRADVSIGVLMSRVAAEVHIYDGRSLERIATESLQRSSRAVLPTSIGIGGDHLFAVVALPFMERRQVRGLARALAREMAAVVEDVVHGE